MKAKKHRKSKIRKNPYYEEALRSSRKVCFQILLELIYHMIYYLIVPFTIDYKAEAPEYVWLNVSYLRNYCLEVLATLQDGSINLLVYRLEIYWTRIKRLVKMGVEMNKSIDMINVFISQRVSHIHTISRKRKSQHSTGEFSKVRNRWGQKY